MDFYIGVPPSAGEAVDGHFWSNLFAPRFFPIRSLHGDPPCCQIPQFLPVVTKALCQKLPATMTSKRRSGHAGLTEDFTATPDPKRRKRNDVSLSIPQSLDPSFNHQFLPCIKSTSIHHTHCLRHACKTDSPIQHHLPLVSITPAPAVCSLQSATQSPAGMALSCIHIMAISPPCTTIYHNTQHQPCSSYLTQPANNAFPGHPLSRSRIGANHH